MRDDLKSCFEFHEEKRRIHLWSIISSLGFTDMQSRQQLIQDAYCDTYQWALTQDVKGLRTWLCTGSDIYWISGKAGSGKSTFMKFLANQRRTYDLLSQWAGSRKHLVVLDCYFWYLGSALQRSIEGLLRNILYQILAAHPGVTEMLFPARWARARSGSSQSLSCWTMKELQVALENVGNAISRTNQGSSSWKFCIFIDGLDEYNGSHGNLLQTLQALTKDGTTKLCVSSRPWNVFINAFENTKPYLSLHELTEGDIRYYVENRLRSYTSYAFASTDLTTDLMASIVNDITSRAEGVFLWVYLVMQSITRGLDEGDDPVVLRGRVLEFPADLESFFDTIIKRVDSVYRYQMSQALVLAYLYAEDHDAAAACSSFLDFELLGRSHTGLFDPQYLWTLEPRKLSSEAHFVLAKRTRRFLSASCKDLLAISLPYGSLDVQSYFEDPSRFKVQFLHRTVFEYLKTSGRIKDLQREVPACFNDGSVFHLLNMGKLKIAWDRQRPMFNPYFLRQVSFSLDHHWTGLNVNFIEQLQECEPLHQRDRCSSIAAAYVAFEQFDAFETIYTTLNSQQLLARSIRPKRFVNKLKTFAPTACTIQSLLAASLGISECRTFAPDNINATVVASIVCTRDSTSPEDDVDKVILRFLERVLPPLFGGCEAASADPTSWTLFFESPAMQHMYGVVQTLGYSGYSGTHVLFSRACPVVGNEFRDIVWRFLTTRMQTWEAAFGLSTMNDTSASYEEIQVVPADPFTCDSYWRNKGDRPSTSTLLRDDELELKRFALHMQMLCEGKGKRPIATPSGTGSILRKRPLDEETDHPHASNKRANGNVARRDEQAVR
jgi:hypothetical protein